MIDGQITIGEFNDSYPPIMDGVAMVMRNYAYWIDRKMGNVCVVTPRVPGVKEEEGFPVIRYASLPLPGRAPYRFGVPALDPSLRSTLDRIPFDIVHAHCPFSSGRLALSVAKSRGIPIVATMHSKYDIDFLQAVKFRWAADLMMKRVMSLYESVDEVWVPNEATRETLSSYGFTGEIVVQPNGTDLEPPNPEEARRLRDAGRAYAGIPDDHEVILYVGQQSRKKNVGLVVSALAELHRRDHRKLTGVFVGTGPDVDSFKKLAGESGVGEHAVFTGAIRDRDLMRSMYAMADLFAFPSSYDTDGIVLKEAAAFQLPAVVMKNTSAASLIQHGENGVTCDDTVKSIADEVGTILKDPKLRRRMGTKALETVYQSSEDVATAVYNRYQEIVARYR